MPKFGYTIVQHSGFGYAGNNIFKRAVEVRGVTSKAQKDLIGKVGGIIFNDYKRAEDFTDKANYPDGKYEGIFPMVKGDFSSKKIDGLAIYVPVREVKS